MGCMKGQIAYHLFLENITGKQVLDKVDCSKESYPEFVEAARKTTFTKIECDMVEEHYRYGVQITDEGIRIEGKYDGKPFTLKVTYEPESTEITGDLTKEEQEAVKNFGWGEQLYYFFKGLDIIYHEQHPETPKLYRCSEC